MRRIRQRLESPPLGIVIARLTAIAAAVLATVWILSRDRGVPVATLILTGTVAIVAFTAESTLFGRHVYAVGGNAEAARRAGIHCSCSPRCSPRPAASSPHQHAYARHACSAVAARYGPRCSARW